MMKKYPNNVELYFYDEIFVNQSLKKSKVLKLKVLVSLMIQRQHFSHL